MGLIAESSLDLRQEGTAATPAAGLISLYAKTTPAGLYIKGSDGVEKQMGMMMTPIAKAAAYTAAPNQQVIMTGAHAVTLPLAPDDGSMVSLLALTADASFARSGTDTITALWKSALTTLSVHVGRNVTLQYLSGVWYAIDGLELADLSFARAYRTAPYTVPTANVWLPVPLDTVAAGYDPGGNFDITTNHRYNVPTAGVYKVIGNLSLQGGANVATQSYAGILKNGADFEQVTLGTFNGGGGSEVVVGDLLVCASGDNIQLGVNSATNTYAIGLGTLSTSLTVVRIA